MTDVKAMKDEAVQEIDRIAEDLIRVSQEIHGNPELGFEEYRASALLTGLLEAEGFEIERGTAGLETAFRATYRGGDGPRVAMVAEMDALRGIGHGCGHNVIGPVAVGGAIALKRRFPEFAGTIEVIGTPAEEGGGGKVHMAERGVFDGLDAAILCHPSNRTMVLRGGLAAVRVFFRFHGKESHAATAPDKGISALDALLSFFTGVNQLRQFAPAGYRIHGIITNGGAAPNIIPALTEAEFSIRAANRAQLEHLKQKVYRIAEASAQSVGATVEINEGLTYAEREENRVLSNAYADNMTLAGAEVLEAVKGVGSSDMGNVGEICPMAHPYVKICDEAIEQHTPAFAEAARSDVAMEALVIGAKAMAMTAIDLAYDAEILAAMQAEFRAYRQRVTNV